MGFQLDFDQTNSIIRVSFTGRLCEEELFAAYSALRAAKARYAPCRCIIDYTRVRTAADVSLATVQKLVNMPPTGSVPQVNVASSDVIFGIALVFRMLSRTTRPNLHVVRTMDEAYRLLGVQRAKFVPLRAA